MKQKIIGILLFTILVITFIVVSPTYHVEAVVTKIQNGDVKQLIEYYVNNSEDDISADDNAGFLNENTQKQCTTGTCLLFGDNYLFNPHRTDFITSSALSSDKFVIAFVDGSNHNYGTALIGDVSGDTISYGEKNVFNSDATDYISVAALSSDKFVIAFRDLSNNYGWAVIGVVSDNTIRYGNELVFNSADTNYISVVSLSADRFVIVYKDVGQSQGKAVIGDVSGYTITFSDWYTFNPGNLDYISAASLTSTKFVIAYNDRSPWSYGTAIIGNVSDNKIEWGNKYVFKSYFIRENSVAALSSDKFVIAYKGYDKDLTEYYGAAVVGDVSDKTLTFGNEYVFYPNDLRFISAAVSTSTKFVIAYKESGDGKAIISDVSDNIISYGKKNKFNSGSTNYVSVAALSSEKFVITYQSDSGYGYAVIGEEASDLQPPVAEANGPYSGYSDLPVVFDGTGSYDPCGTIVSYDWDFGDGKSGSGSTPTHVYDDPGSYTVILTVEDNDGSTDTDSTTAVLLESAGGELMDSPWPMYKHDVRHTGQSPYNTSDNPYVEKWRVKGKWIDGDAVIDNEGIIYFGDHDSDLFALYTNGTIKWKVNLVWPFNIMCTPAISENGILYVGTHLAEPNYLYSINTSNGNVQWKFKTGHHVTSSPSIGSDGSIYFGDWNGFINALYSNGTVKWRYKTGNSVLSSPVIGDDGTIYCGSHDNYLYALYENNGTLKWRYETGYWVRVSPCIDDDGIVYFVSRDGYLYALYPNGILKWKTHVGAGTHPSIGHDGTIYAGFDTLYAIDPIDGSIKWGFNPGNYSAICGGSPCISADGIIYFGTNVRYPYVGGGEIIALNSDGTERWRKRIAEAWVDSSPCIGEDGTVYIGSVFNAGKGYLHAFGSVDSNAPPSTPMVEGTTNGKIGEEYYYTFTSVDPDNNPVSYYVDWGDGTTTETLDFASGEQGYASHVYNEVGNYTIMVKARDTLGEESDWGTLSVSMPRNKVSDTLLLQLINRYLGRFPLLTRLLSIWGM